MSQFACGNGSIPLPVSYLFIAAVNLLVLVKVIGYCCVNFFPTYLLCVYVRVYLHICICVYVHVYMCGQYVMCTMFICNLCYLLWSLCSFCFVFPFLRFLRVA